MDEHIARTEKQLGAAIRRARRRAGLSQSELGSRFHLRQGTVSKLEAGEPVQLHTVMVALSALGLELVVRPRTQGSVADIADLF